ncbi:hypothetical protein HHI36_002690, partial [Cryptolaemus montrouzieri]
MIRLKNEKLHVKSAAFVWLDFDLKYESKGRQLLNAQLSMPNRRTNLGDEKQHNLQRTKMSLSGNGINQAAFRCDFCTDFCLHTSIGMRPMDVVWIEIL